MCSTPRRVNVRATSTRLGEDSRLNQETVRAVNSAESTAIYEKMGFIQATSTPEQLAQRIERETKMWSGLIKKLGIKPE